MTRKIETNPAFRRTSDPQPLLATKQNQIIKETGTRKMRKTQKKGIFNNTVKG